MTHEAHFLLRLFVFLLASLVSTNADSAAFSNALSPPIEGTHHDQPRGDQKGKNIVICCDGTGMGIGSNDHSKVVHLVQMAVHSNGKKVQRDYYSPGIGVVSRIDPWDFVSVLKEEILGLATGSGLLARNVAEAYRFLVRNYNEGDKIFLFGFSRGAHAVRVLAALMTTVGLLRPDQEYLVPNAIAAYTNANLWDGENPNKYSAENALDHFLEADNFGMIVNARKDVPIHFMGCWDTVSTMIMPRVSIIWPFPSTMLPFTDASNFNVRHFRQACAIDERRRGFRLEYWSRRKPWIHEINQKIGYERKPRPGSWYWSRWNSWLQKANSKEQYKDKSQKEMWFVGCHGDTGGGWPRNTSGLSTIALRWILDEATQKGLVLAAPIAEDPTFFENTSGNSTFFGIHDSLQGGWRFHEILTKLHSRRDFEWTSSFRGILTRTALLDIYSWASANAAFFGATVVYRQAVRFRSLLWLTACLGASFFIFSKTYTPESYTSEPLSQKHQFNSSLQLASIYYRRAPTSVRIAAGIGMFYLMRWLGDMVSSRVKTDHIGMFHQVKWVGNMVSSRVGTAFIGMFPLITWVGDVVSSRMKIDGIGQTPSWWVKFSLIIAFMVWRHAVEPVYIPLGEPRWIPPEDEIHPSVLQRTINDESYRPVNLVEYLSKKDISEADIKCADSWEVLAEKMGQCAVRAGNA